MDNTVKSAVVLSNIVSSQCTYPNTGGRIMLFMGGPGTQVATVNNIVIPDYHSLQLYIM